MSEKDDHFYDRADAHIHLANKHVTEEIGMGKVSASFMFGMSRYAAFVSACGCGNKQDMQSNREQHIQYFVDEFRKAIEDNYDDYIENFAKYME